MIKKVAALSAIKADIDAWRALYPMIDGIFFDEVSGEKDKTRYYQSLNAYAAKKQPAGVVVFNVGGIPHPDYFENMVDLVSPLHRAEG